MSTTRAVGYVRLSGKGERTTSPERQREAIEGYCKARGWTLGGIVEDIGESGSEVGKGLERPGLATFRADWPDVIVVAKLDRMARNVADFSAFTREAKEHDCAVASVFESLDTTTPMGRFAINILAGFAQMESEQIRERIVSMREAVRGAETWRYMGGTVPIGYRPVPRAGGGKTLGVHEPEAELLREAARRVLAGESLWAVCKDWNERGVKSKKGGAWKTWALHAALTGYSAIGVPSHKGEPRRGPDGLPQAAFPPILSRDEHARLRTRLARKPRRKARTPTQLLSGLLFCSCGKKMYAAKGRGNKRMYKCNGRVTGCRVDSVQAHLADPVVEAAVLAAYGDFPVSRVERVESAARDELAAVEDAIASAAASLARDDSDVAEVAARVEALRGRRAELRAAPTVEERDVYTGQDFAGLWESSDIPGRAKLLRAVLERVEVGPGAPGGRFNPARLAIVWLTREEQTLVTPATEFNHHGIQWQLGEVVLRD